MTILTRNQKPDLSNEASEQWSVQDIVDNKGQVLINSERREIKKANVIRKLETELA